MFPGVVANDHIDLSVRRGEIHSLAGENGAGKSTLMGILYGLQQPDEGTILLRGEEVRLASPKDAIRHGLGMVHQHFMLIPKFTVTQNIILGMEVGSRLRIDYPKAEEEIRQLSQRYGLGIDPAVKVSELSVTMQQRVEILKILYRKAEILIFDEPTAVLTPQEIDEFCDILIRLRDSGKTILFISHKLAEVETVSYTHLDVYKRQGGDRMKLEFEYGQGMMSAQLPDDTDVFIPGETVPDPPCIPEEKLVEATRESILHPMGMPPLSQLAHKGSKVVIVFPDRVKGGEQPTAHRKVSIPIILEELYKAGVEKKDILLLCSNGLHRKNTEEEIHRVLGDELFSQFWPTGQIRNHDSEDYEHLVDLGTTPRGDPVLVNKYVYDADVAVLDVYKRQGGRSPRRCAGC